MGMRIRHSRARTFRVYHRSEGLGKPGRERVVALHEYLERGEVGLEDRFGADEGQDDGEALGEHAEVRLGALALGLGALLLAERLRAARHEPDARVVVVRDDAFDDVVHEVERAHGVPDWVAHEQVGHREVRAEVEGFTGRSFVEVQPWAAMKEERARTCRLR